MIFLQPMSTTLAQETQNHFVYGCLSPYSYAWVISGKKHFQPTSGCANFDHLSIKTLALDILIVGIVLFQYIQYCISKGSYDSKVSSLLYCSSSYLLVHGQRDCASIHLHFYGFFSVVLIVGIFFNVSFCRYICARFHHFFFTHVGFFNQLLGVGYCQFSIK